MASWWLGVICLCVGMGSTLGGEVNTSSVAAVVGSTASITCSYSLDENEVLEYIYIDTYVRNAGFVDLVTFYENGTNIYAPAGASLRNRTTLMNGENEVVLRFDGVECTDLREYYCNLKTNETSVYGWMMLQVRGLSEKPSIMMQKQSGCYGDGDMVDAVCVGLVGGFQGKFHWYGMRNGTTVDLTSLADHGMPYRPPGSTCTFKRASHISFNFTADDDGLVIRCLIKDEGAGITPQVEDDCGEFCVDTQPIYMIRPAVAPRVSMFSPDLCPGHTFRAACYGEIGNPSAHYHWYRIKEGEEPVSVHENVDPGAPYRLHNSCQYERASMISVSVTQAEDGVLYRCMLADQASGIEADPTAPCGPDTYCDETKKIKVHDCSKRKKRKPTPKAKPTSGATTQQIATALPLLFPLFMYHMIARDFPI